MHRKIATILTAASLLVAVPLAPVHAYYLGYNGGSGGVQSPSRYSHGGSGAYGRTSMGASYIGIDTTTNITRKHGSDYYAREYAQQRIRNASTQAPCGQYTRKPLGCKFSTMSYREYEAINR